MSEIKIILIHSLIQGLPKRVGIKYNTKDEYIHDKTFLIK